MGVFGGSRVTRPPPERKRPHELVRAGPAQTPSRLSRQPHRPVGPARDDPEPAHSGGGERRIGDRGGSHSMRGGAPAYPLEFDRSDRPVGPASDGPRPTHSGGGEGNSVIEAPHGGPTGAGRHRAARLVAGVESSPTLRIYTCPHAGVYLLPQPGVKFASLISQFRNRIYRLTLA